MDGLDREFGWKKKTMNDVADRVHINNSSEHPQTIPLSGDSKVCTNLPPLDV